MSKGEAVTKKELDGVVRWFEQGGEAAKVFRESLEAGGLITDDVMRVCAGVDGLLKSGLDRGALAVLVTLKGPKQSGGHNHGKPKLAQQTVLDVFDALERLPELLTAPKKAELTKRIEERPEPRPPGLTDEEWAWVQSNRNKTTRKS